METTTCILQHFCGYILQRLFTFYMISCSQPMVPGFEGTHAETQKIIREQNLFDTGVVYFDQ